MKNYSLIDNLEELFQEDNAIHMLPRPLRTFIMVIGLTFALLGLVTNLSTIVVLCRYKKMRNETAYFILSLCCTDLICSLLAIPFDSIRFIDTSWTQNSALCMIVPYFRYASETTCLISIVAVTINRYFMIVHPKIYRKIFTLKWITCMIGSIWIFSYTSMIPTLLGVWGKIGYNSHRQACVIIADSQSRSLKVWMQIIGFLLPVLTMIVCYTKIFWLVKKSGNRIRHVMLLTPGTGRTFKSHNTEHEILKMVVIIFIGFVICNFPIMLVKILNPHLNNSGFKCMAYLMLYSHVWINPVIYGAMNKKYRVAYWDMISCSRKSRTLSKDTLGEHNSTTKSDMNSHTLNPNMNEGSISIIKIKPLEYLSAS